MTKQRFFNPWKLVCYLLVLCPSTGFGQLSKAKEIDAYIAPFVKAKHFSGVILAAENGKVIYEKAFGFANADFKIPNQINTRIGIASITKMMTSVIRIRLMEEGKVSLGDKVSKYIPDFPNGDKITIEMLARHRSGILHRVMNPEEEAVPHTSAEMVEKIKRASLAFEPGTESLYSSAGYTLLARVLEIASGKTYSQLLQQYVFNPAGMNNSLEFDGEAIIDRRAQEYMLDAKGIINAALKDYSFLVGAGSVFSTARDLYQFGEAIVSGKFGESLHSNSVIDEIVSGGGFTNGHRAFLKINAKKKYGYVLLSNLASGANDAIIPALEAIMEGKETSLPVIPHPSIVSSTKMHLENFVGQYRRQGGSATIKLLVKNGLLYAGDIKLSPTGANCFFEYQYYGEVCFVRDTTGKIKEINWSSPGAQSVWVRR